MNIQLWYSNKVNEWRWTMTTDNPEEFGVVMESGTQKKLSMAMEDVYRTVKHLRTQVGLKTD